MKTKESSRLVPKDRKLSVVIWARSSSDALLIWLKPSKAWNLRSNWANIFETENLFTPTWTTNSLKRTRCTNTTVSPDNCKLMKKYYQPVRLYYSSSFSGWCGTPTAIGQPLVTSRFVWPNTAGYQQLLVLVLGLPLYQHKAKWPSQSTLNTVIRNRLHIWCLKVARPILSLLSCQLVISPLAN